MNHWLHALTAPPLTTMGPFPLLSAMAAKLLRPGSSIMTPIPLVVCDGCEVVKARVKHHDARGFPAGIDDILLIRDEVFLPQPVIRDDLYLTDPEVRDNADLDQFVPRCVREPFDPETVASAFTFLLLAFRTILCIVWKEEHAVLYAAGDIAEDRSGPPSRLFVAGDLRLSCVAG